MVSRRHRRGALPVIANRVLTGVAEASHRLIVILGFPYIIAPNSAQLCTDAIRHAK